MLKHAESMKKRGFADIQFINLGGGLAIDYRKHVSFRVGVKLLN
jgi:diaminopimelate decarboxylase